MILTARRLRTLVACAVAAAATFSMQAASAFTYNESVNGDLSDDGATPTALGTLAIGSNTVIASLSTHTDGSEDAVDNFSFVVGAGDIVSHGTLTYNLGSFNVSGNFAVRNASNTILTTFNSNTTPSGTDVLGPLNLRAGNYSILLLGFGTTVGLQSYAWNITAAPVATIPEPASMALMGAGLACLVFVSQRRKR